MPNKRFNCDTRHTKKILTIDESFVRGVVMNCTRDNYRMTFENVLLSTYNKYECTCPLCDAGNKKKQRRPAVFIPTEVGYLFKCLACMNNEGAIVLYNFLSKHNKDLARKYQEERWVKKLTGEGFNVKDPDHKVRKAYYQEQERKLKERNKREYERRNDMNN